VRQVVDHARRLTIIVHELLDVRHAAAGFC